MELYLHIPYCRQKCRYCDFPSYPCQEATMPAYVDAVLKEADTLSAVPPFSAFFDTPLDTVFIGGGTPSILPTVLLRRLLGGIRERMQLAEDVEFTTEANPGTLTSDWLEAAIAGGVNRLSMGMQAFQPDLLRTLGRIHTYEQVADSVRMAREAGIRSLNLDLMFGLPGQTREMWRESLEAALDLSPEHLSCYGLIPEEGTPLRRDLDAGRLSLPDEEEERAMYDDALSLLACHGYRQYEISNFALPGHECRHNIGYWRQVPYLGLGASAASFLRTESCWLRTANPPLIRDYMDMVNGTGSARRDVTPVSAADLRFETVMLGLRMTDGISESAFEATHGVSLRSLAGSVIDRHIRSGLLHTSGGRIFLTRRGMDLQNAILVDFMEAMDP